MRGGNGRILAAVTALSSLGGCGPLGTIVEDVAERLWTRHVIDNDLSGADGVRRADINRDELPDLVAAFEGAGRVAIYANPDFRLVEQEWPTVVIGRVPAAEDATFADLDGDGQLDVVSAAEGDTRAIFVHWSPTDSADRGDAQAWETIELPSSKDVRWLAVTIADVDDDGQVEIIAGAKDRSGQVAILDPGLGDPRNPNAWDLRGLTDAAWVMSLIPLDFDSDGDVDILYSDRKGPERGVYWLENRGFGATGAPAFIRHSIGTSDDELMFLDVGDVDGDVRLDVVVATDARSILHFESATADLRASWLLSEVIPFDDRFGTGKAVKIADVDRDLQPDLVFTCENAGGRNGVGWLRRANVIGAVDVWRAMPIGGKEGSKFDRIEIFDVDQDGDVDVVSTEENENLGVIWYENPNIMP